MNQIQQESVPQEPAKKDPKNEEENKADFVFASSANISKTGLEPSSSIFGGKPVKTIIIQDSPPQIENMKKNKRSVSNPLENHSPFVKFPNILNDNICSGPTSNAFFDAFFLAYALHGEVVLSPDDVWLQINNCFVTYVNQNPEKLRNKIVSFKDKKDLVVLYDEQDPNFQNFRHKSFRWDVIVNNFSTLIQKNTLEKLPELIECNYSTTGAIEKIASQVSLMHTCEKYFNYRMGVCGCGIQKIHFLGEEKDWKDLKGKLTKLKNYELKGESQYDSWITKLDQILDNFINTYRNEPDVKFWNSIVQKFQGYELKIGGSGRRYYELSDFINGWILDFFLFDKDEKYFSMNLIDRPLEKPDEGDWRKEKVQQNSKRKDKKGTTFNCFPAGISKAPVLIEYCYGPRKGEKIPVDFLGGFTGVVNENNIYRPQISFAVADREITDEEKSFKPLWKMI